MQKRARAALPRSGAGALLAPRPTQGCSSRFGRFSSRVLAGRRHTHTTSSPPARPQAPKIEQERRGLASERGPAAPSPRHRRAIAAPSPPPSPLWRLDHALLTPTHNYRARARTHTATQPHRHTHTPTHTHTHTHTHTTKPRPRTLRLAHTYASDPFLSGA